MKMDDMKFPVYSPCCHGAHLGYAYWEGYRVFGCKGCGKTLPRGEALREIRLAMRVLRNSGAWMESFKMGEHQ